MNAEENFWEPTAMVIRSLRSEYQAQEITKLVAELDRKIEAEQAEIWRSDPLQIIPKITRITGLKWNKGPIGAWNSRRIVGCQMSVRVQFRKWFWVVQYSQWAEWSFWLCFGISITWEYGDFVD